MNAPIRFSKNAIDELEKLVRNNNPVLSTQKGELFISGILPLSAIKLKIGLDQYLAEIAHTKDRGVEIFNIVPCENSLFNIVINAPLTISDHKVMLAGKEVKIL